MSGDISSQDWEMRGIGCLAEIGGLEHRIQLRITTWHRFSLSLGERAGVRANFLTIRSESCFHCPKSSNVLVELRAGGDFGSGMWNTAARLPAESLRNWNRPYR